MIVFRTAACLLVLFGVAAPAWGKKRPRVNKSERKVEEVDKAEAGKSRRSERRAPAAEAGSPGVAAGAAASRDESGANGEGTGRGANAAATTSERSGPAPKARVYTFGGLDVTGTLKAPQMLYFRARVQQELDTSDRGKRSFLKELEGTADAKGL